MGDVSISYLHGSLIQRLPACEVRTCSYSIGTYFTFFLRLKVFKTFGKFSIRSALTDDNWKYCGTCLANIYYPSTHYYPPTTQLRILTKHTIYWNNVLCRPTLAALMINRLLVVGPIIQSKKHREFLWALIFNTLSQAYTYVRPNDCTMYTCQTF